MPRRTARGVGEWHHCLVERGRDIIGRRKIRKPKIKTRSTHVTEHWYVLIIVTLFLSNMYASGFSARRTGFSSQTFHVEWDNFHSNFFGIPPSSSHQCPVFFRLSSSWTTDNEPIRSLSSTETIFHTTTTERAKIRYRS